MNTELTLLEWLEQTQPRRDELDTYARSAMPMDAVERHGDMGEVIRASDDAGRLLADAESYLSLEKAQALMGLMQDDLNAKDRDIIMRSKVRGVQRLVDGLTVTVKSLNNRMYISMNANRSRL